jgi:deazaflavin-dependent oxidoreductase (nitroreductase family)
VSVSDEIVQVIADRRRERDGRNDMDSPEVTTIPMPPSVLVRVVMRPMTKMLNPLVRRMAGKKHMNMAALVFHTGRRSGREYATPAGARLVGDEFLIPLTFGTESDWCRNLRAAGGGKIRWKAKDYQVTAPEIFAMDSIGPLLKKTFKPYERAFMRMMGIKRYLDLKVVAPQS